MSLNTTLIDTHQHIIPPFYLEENRSRIASARGGQISPAWLGWSAERMIDTMDVTGIAASVISLSTPGVWFGDKLDAAKTARRCNEYAADLIARYPKRLGFFGAIAAPDIDRALEEVAYALDELHADGIGLLTSYDNRWLGDPLYDPLLDELNRRKATVFVHPTVPSCCRNLLPDVPPVIVEVPQDTTRAIVNLLLSGTLSRFRDLTFIFSHAGGYVPMVLGRIHQYAPKEALARLHGGVEAELRRHYFDIAGTTYPSAVAALTKVVPISQILFGTDGPYVPVDDSVSGLQALELNDSERESVARGNALQLLPRLSTRLL
jgi:predicted TIM-barrel fold metal-dependent hydrolase